MPNNTPNISQIAPFNLKDLEECSEESVYAPGHIQPHGIVLLLQEKSLKILQASENVEQFFGISAAELLGQQLPGLLGHEQVQEIVRYLAQEQLNIHNSFDLKIPLKDGTIQTFRSTLHQLPDELILELEAQGSIEKNHSIDFYHRLQTVILNFRTAIGLSDLAQTIAREVKALTGFDRVMIYRFEADEHGVVIAEEKESYL
ncbi:PAS domain-containing protein, partial [Microcoleus sp. herbarium5]|uniref:PAS domain-containing protein n=1 Tax=Microcoleus sp. herbarium5 TaxID=3055434 RepID=UPI002FD628A8